MATKINVSFKETEKEMYDFLLNQLSPSIYLKGLIKNEMQKNGNKEQEVNSPKNHNLFNF